MLHRLKPPILVATVGVALAFLAVATLRNAAPEIAAAAIILSVMIAGAGVGASVGPQHRRR